MLIAVIIIYAAAMTAANLSAAALGPWVTPINAFVLVGLDLALRNWLALKMNAASMVALIATAAGISYVLNPATGQIALASLVAFTASAIADWATFRTIPGQWIRRCLGGVTAGAAVDSLLFPTIAFGALMPSIVGLQFAAKVAGGAAWSFAIARVMKEQQ